MDVWIPLAVLGILAIPVLIVILLIVYIAKTNKLSRNTAALEGDLLALRKELARLARASAAVEFQGGSRPDATEAAQAQSPAADLGNKDPHPFPPSFAAEATPLLTPAEVQPPGEPEVYVSPYRNRVTEGREGAAKPSYLGPDESVPETPSTPARAKAIFSSSTHKEPQTATARTSRTRAEWESLIGGRLLNWIGALAIIIGIGSFLG